MSGICSRDIVEIESNRKLEVQLYGCTLMGSLQGIQDGNINLNTKTIR